MCKAYEVEICKLYKYLKKMLIIIMLTRDYMKFYSNLNSLF